MIDDNKILKTSQEVKKKYKCRNCYIIRIFLLAVVLIILLALLQSDNLHYLEFVTPTNAAILIIVSGVIMFLIKLTKYIFNKNN